MILTGRCEETPSGWTRPAVPRQGADSLGWEDHTQRRETAVSVLLNPYLSFPDAQAREALEFYQSVLGGQLDVMTFGDVGTDGPIADQVMHGQLTTPGGITLMGADAPPDVVQVTYGDNVSVSLSGGPEDAELLRGWFAALSDGGEVRQPLEAAPWGDEFGMFVDRFGIAWMVNIAGAAAS
ncbi:VOC family protein [Alloalcanivorax gelatiniphagus]